MSVVIGSICVQGAQALMGHENFGNYDLRPGSLLKAVCKTGAAISAVALGSIGGGYYGAMTAKKLTENYYKRNGDPSKMATWSIGLSMLCGAVTGATVGGCVATAISVNSLDLF